MASFEDLIRGNVMGGVALGAVALALPIVVPTLRAPMRTAVKTGLTLFLEAEFELDGEVIDQLVEGAIESLSTIVEESASQPVRRQQAEAVIQQFTTKARKRAHRYGASDRDRAARYRRHIAKLKHAVSQAQSSAGEAAKLGWEHIAGMVTEDW